jgi:hypothetical protein
MERKGKGRSRTGRAVLFGLLVLLAGCAADNGAAHSDNGKNGGFYGGMTGGGVQP